MSELRQDPTTREWVILAPERARRPLPKHEAKTPEKLPPRDPSCPFCPGNEDRTPDEVFRLPLEDSKSWDVRVVPNRFPALEMDQPPVRQREGQFARKIDGFGVHEVIIESPSHNTPMALMTYEQVEKVLTAYHERYNTLKEDSQLKFITIFKNHGWASGTSLVHPHSQLVATPIITPYYHRRLDVAVDYFADNGACIYCDLLLEEMEKEKRIVAATPDYVILHPYASRSPWETWIVPRIHRASFGLLLAQELKALARVLKDTLLCFYRELNNPSFNLMIDTTTTEDEDDPYYHWHIRVLPRVTNIAGFELGSGIYISPALPEDTARLMKEMVRILPDGEGVALKQGL